MNTISRIRFLNSYSDNRKSKDCTELNRSIKNPKWVQLLAFLVLLVGYVGVAQAQQQAKIPRIGFLGSTSFSGNPARREAFRQGLRELGYVEGKTIDVEWRFAEGKAERLPGLAAELVDRNI